MNIKKLLLALFIGMSIAKVSAQSNCDSLEINCCNFQIFGNDTITLEVMNHATQEIFDYPGFVILAQNGDTIAKEQVNYFGIGVGWQTHYLQVQNSITFPFTGTLQLHGLFYDTLYCEFPLVLNSMSVEDKDLNLQIGIYPNPVTHILFLKGKDYDHYEIHDLTGQLLLANLIVDEKLDVAFLETGIYFIRCFDKNEKETISIPFYKY